MSQNDFKIILSDIRRQLDRYGLLYGTGIDSGESLELDLSEIEKTIEQAEDFTHEYKNCSHFYEFL